MHGAFPYQAEGRSSGNAMCEPKRLPGDLTCRPSWNPTLEGTWICGRVAAVSPLAFIATFQPSSRAGGAAEKRVRRPLPHIYLEVKNKSSRGRVSTPYPISIPACSIEISLFADFLTIILDFLSCSLGSQRFFSPLTMKTMLLY